MKLKGIKLKGTYQVKFNDAYFEVYDDKGNVIYYGDSDGYWFKNEYDKKGNRIYYENSNGYWSKSEYDERNNQTHYEDSFGNIVDRCNSWIINRIK